MEQDYNLFEDDEVLDNQLSYIEELKTSSKNTSLGEEENEKEVDVHEDDFDVFNELFGEELAQNYIVPKSLGKVSHDAQDTFNYFTQVKGYSPVHAKAIAGNLQAESQNKPINYDDGANGAGGGGIAQWSPTRYKELKQFASKKGLDWKSKETQLDFIDWELKNTESKAGQVFFNSQTIQDATQNLMHHYFRPNKDPKINHIDKRQGYANFQSGGFRFRQPEQFQSNNIGYTPINPSYSNTNNLDMSGYGNTMDKQMNHFNDVSGGDENSFSNHTSKLIDQIDNIGGNLIGGVNSALAFGKKYKNILGQGASNSIDIISGMLGEKRQLKNQYDIINKIYDNDNFNEGVVDQLLKQKSIWN